MPKRFPSLMDVSACCINCMSHQLAKVHCIVRQQDKGFLSSSQSKSETADKPFTRSFTSCDSTKLTVANVDTTWQHFRTYSHSNRQLLHTKHLQFSVQQLSVCSCSKPRGRGAVCDSWFSTLHNSLFFFLQTLFEVFKCHTSCHYIKSWCAALLYTDMRSSLGHRD